MIPSRLCAVALLALAAGPVASLLETSPLAARKPVAERRGEKLVYRADRSFGARVGPGGPELLFDAFNGDIRVLKGGR